MVHGRSHIVDTKRRNDISLLNFKNIVAQALIGRYSSCKRSMGKIPEGQAGKNLMNHHPQRSPNLHAQVTGGANDIPLLQE